LIKKIVFLYMAESPIPYNLNTLANMLVICKGDGHFSENGKMGHFPENGKMGHFPENDKIGHFPENGKM
jgi:hypothetical protein